MDNAGIIKRFYEDVVSNSLLDERLRYIDGRYGIPLGIEGASGQVAGPLGRRKRAKAIHL